MCAKRLEERMSSPRELLETLRRLGYNIPEPVANGSAHSMPEDDKPFSYNIPITDGGGDATSFDTKDDEIQSFVTNLKRKRLRTKVLSALVVVVVVASLAALVFLVIR